MSYFNKIDRIFTFLRLPWCWRCKSGCPSIHLKASFSRVGVSGYVRIRQVVGRSKRKLTNIELKQSYVIINTLRRAVVFICGTLLPRGSVQRGGGGGTARGQRTGDLRMNGVDEVTSDSCSVSLWSSEGVWSSSRRRWWENGSVCLCNSFRTPF